METEGRFNRAIRECESHGTRQQLFNIKYDFALTDLFWFRDVDAAYHVFRELKPFLKEDPRESRVEGYTNILTDLYNASKKGLFDAEALAGEVKFLKDLKTDLETANDHKASLLYLNLYFTEISIVDKVANGCKEVDGLIEQLREYLIQSGSYIEISCDANERILRLLSELLPDNEKLSTLVDDVADMMMRRKDEISTGRFLLERAELNFKKRQFKDAIRRLGKCVVAFNKNGAETELVKAISYMGVALSEENLLYSAECYLVRAASMHVHQLYSQGTIHPFLPIVLQELMRIEIRLGRLVMFLNWNELRNTLSVNSQVKNSEQYRNDCTAMDAAWACLFSTSDLSDPLFERLPDVLWRQEMMYSSCYLKTELGWEEDIDQECRKLLPGDLNQWNALLRNQPAQGEFQFNLNVSRKGDAYLETVAGNCRFRVVYENTLVNQTVAETFLAALESLASTMEFQKMIFTRKQVRLKIVSTSKVESCEMKYQDGDYILYLNEGGVSDSTLWKSFLSLLALMNGNRDLISSPGIVELLGEKQKSENLVSCLSFMMQHHSFLTVALGKCFRYRIEDWQSDQDKVYKRRRAAGSSAVDHSLNNPQLFADVCRLNSDMSLWDQALWHGCSFLFNPCGAVPPVLGLLFKNIAAGFRIFDELKEREKHGSLKIGIVIARHIDRNHPSWYRVCITPERKAVNKEVKEGTAFILGLTHDMDAESDEKVVALEKEFKRYGHIGIAPMSVEIIQNHDLGESLSRCVMISRISIVNEWEITSGSWETVAVRWNDAPYIPAGMEGKAPVLELLRNLKSA